MSSDVKKRPAGAPDLKPLKGYFDEDDDDDHVINSFEQADRTSNSSSSRIPLATEEEEIDPLDAFMAGVQEEVKKNESTVRAEVLQFQDEDDRGEEYGEVLDNDDDDSGAENGRMDGASAAAVIDYDSDGNPSSASRSITGKAIVEPLQTVDHKTIAYSKFQRHFHREHPEIKAMTDEEVSSLREELEVTVEGGDVPRPLIRFEHACFDVKLLREIYKYGYQKPTAIQAQAIPLALAGRDIIGLAKTGSGKTLAYTWPMLIHVAFQTSNGMNAALDLGPVAIVLAPTRELVQQIYQEVKKFSHVYGLTVCPIYGGAGKYEMIKALKDGPEIVVATPGRLIELVKLKSTSLSRCTMIVMDEADKMFEMGFEAQISCILRNIRGDRQVLLFSATMKKKVEDFVRRSFSNPTTVAAAKADLGAAYCGNDLGLVRLVIGRIGQANPDIQQLPVVLRNVSEKWQWLSTQIDDFVAYGKVLIFVGGKQSTEDLCKSLQDYFRQRQLDIAVAYLHGDIDQSERTKTIKRFSKSTIASIDQGQSGAAGEITVLVATDIASRGLDIKNVQTVVNYEVPKNIEVYVHRIGRTGRLGVEGVKPGTAYTLLCKPHDSSFAVDLVQNLHVSNQTVPPDLQQLAESDPKWGKIKHLSARGGGHRGSYHGMNSNAGLGNGGRQAMTSEMMAMESRATSSILTPGMNFGKLLGVSAVAKDEANAEGVATELIFKGEDVTRSSRPIDDQSSSAYAPIFAPPADSSAPVLSSVTAPAGTTLKGFVRSSQTLTSVDQNHASKSVSVLIAETTSAISSTVNAATVATTTHLDAVQSSNPADDAGSSRRKRSRWDA